MLLILSLAVTDLVEVRHSSQHRASKPDCEPLHLVTHHLHLRARGGAGQPVNELTSHVPLDSPAKVPEHRGSTLQIRDAHKEACLQLRQGKE